MYFHPVESSSFRLSRLVNIAHIEPNEAENLAARPHRVSGGLVVEDDVEE
jgi:hypothetical protein